MKYFSEWVKDFTKNLDFEREFMHSGLLFFLFGVLDLLEKLIKYQNSKTVNHKAGISRKLHVIKIIIKIIDSPSQVS